MKKLSQHKLLTLSLFISFISNVAWASPENATSNTNETSVNDRCVTRSLANRIQSKLTTLLRQINSPEDRVQRQANRLNFQNNSDSRLTTNLFETQMSMSFYLRQNPRDSEENRRLALSIVGDIRRNIYSRSACARYLPQSINARYRPQNPSTTTVPTTTGNADSATASSCPVPEGAIDRLKLDFDAFKIRYNFQVKRNELLSQMLDSQFDIFARAQISADNYETIRINRNDRNAAKQTNQHWLASEKRINTLISETEVLLNNADPGSARNLISQVIPKLTEIEHLSANLLRTQGFVRRYGFAKFERATGQEVNMHGPHALEKLNTADREISTGNSERTSIFWSPELSYALSQASISANQFDINTPWPCPSKSSITPTDPSGAGAGE